MADQKISELTELTTPVDADEFVLSDTDVATTKKLTWANIKVALDLIYSALVHTHTESDITDLGSYIGASGVTYENLSANSDIGTGATQVSQGDHTHSVSGTLVGSSVATTDVRNTVTETAILSETIDANTLGTTGAIHARIFFSDFDSDGSTVVFKIKYGSTTLITSSSLTPQTDQVGYIDIYLIGAGTTGTQEANYHIFAHKQATSTASSHHTLMNYANGTASEDSTGALTFTVTAQWSGASAGSGITVEGYVVNKIIA